MKKLLIFVVFGFFCAFMFAQDNYLGASVHPQLGRLASLQASGEMRAVDMEFNLGRVLGKGKIFETGIGIQQRSFRFRYFKNLENQPKEGTLPQQSTLLIAPARIRLHLNQRSEGHHQVWLNLGYIYGRRILVDTWARTDRANGTEATPEPTLAGKNFHFVEFGLEMDAPLGQKHRIGLGLNYTQTITPAGTSSHFNGSFQFAGIKIRFSRRTW
jgi:hypothetical protein